MMTIRSGNQVEAAEDLARVWRPLLFKAAATAIAKALMTLLSWQNRELQRFQLLELSDRTLHDIGLNRLDAVRGAEKPFWR